MARGIESNIMEHADTGKPEDEWECFDNGYKEKVFARARSNPLLIFYNYSTYDSDNKGSDQQDEKDLHGDRETLPST